MFSSREDIVNIKNELEKRQRGENSDAVFTKDDNTNNESDVTNGNETKTVKNGTQIAADVVAY